MRGSARKYDVRMAQFVLKIEKLSHIMGPGASQDLRSPSLIMAPVNNTLPVEVMRFSLLLTRSESDLSRFVFVLARVLSQISSRQLSFLSVYQRIALFLQ